MNITITMNNFRTVVRELMFDKGATPAYTDAQIYRGVENAWSRLTTLNAASRYGADGKLRDVEFPSSAEAKAAFSWQTEDRWVRGLEYYAAAQCLEANIKDTVKLQLAQTLYQKADAIFAI